MKPEEMTFEDWQQWIEKEFPGVSLETPLSEIIPLLEQRIADQDIFIVMLREARASLWEREP